MVGARRYSCITARSGFFVVHRLDTPVIVQGGLRSGCVIENFVRFAPIMNSTGAKMLFDKEIGDGVKFRILEGTVNIGFRNRALDPVILCGLCEIKAEISVRVEDVDAER